jgi:STE24 endopeptidase
MVLLSHLKRLRQYPLYSKTEPPPSLKDHFTPEVFSKSQEYGKDKAMFSFVMGLFKQCFESTMIQFGIYAWAWTFSGFLMLKFGYGAEYEVGVDVDFCAQFTHQQI